MARAPFTHRPFTMCAESRPEAMSSREFQSVSDSGSSDLTSCPPRSVTSWPTGSKVGGDAWTSATVVVTPVPDSIQRSPVLCSMIWYSTHCGQISSGTRRW